MVVVAQAIQIERFGLPDPLGAGHPQPRIGQRHPGIAFHQQDAFFQVCRLHGVVGVQAADIKPFATRIPVLRAAAPWFSWRMIVGWASWVGPQARPAPGDIVGRSVIDHDDLEILQGLRPDAGDGVLRNRP